MKRVFVDFEMNPVEKKFSEERKCCSREIIEIGAVMLNDNFEEISSFKCFVKPEYNSLIYKKYEELTGVSNSMIAGADKFEKAFQSFIDWCGHDEYEIYAWSNSDKTKIEKEMLLKGFEKNKECKYMLDHWIDF